MELSGKKLAEPILADVKERVLRLEKNGTIPELAIVTVGEEDAWISYVAQKVKTAEKLGIKTRIINLDGDNEEKLQETVKDLNENKNIHGIIIQRPLPKSYNREKLLALTDPEKDIDGFRDDSPHTTPVVLAVENFIRQANGVITASDFQKVLINQSICVVGKGETAGSPVIEWLSSIKAGFSIIDSKTIDPCLELKKADIVISAIGKSGVVKLECLKKGAVVIGIGIRREGGKLMGDYDESEIKDVTKAYTPTPGGVGPLNLSYLFQNLVTAAENQALK